MQYYVYCMDDPMHACFILKVQENLPKGHLATLLSDVRSKGGGLACAWRVNPLLDWSGGTPRGPFGWCKGSRVVCSALEEVCPARIQEEEVKVRVEAILMNLSGLFHLWWKFVLRSLVKW